MCLQQSSCAPHFGDATQGDRFGECLLKIKEAHIVCRTFARVTRELITSSSFVADSLVSQVQHNTSLEQLREDQRHELKFTSSCWFLLLQRAARLALWIKNIRPVNISHKPKYCSIRLSPCIRPLESKQQQTLEIGQL